MNNFSIMPLDTAHLEEICLDIIRQHRDGIATMPLFMVKLVPEGVPPIDKAKIEGKKFVRFRDRLAEADVPAGILVQCSIGHGYKLDSTFGFQHYVKLFDGGTREVACPYDEGVRAYFTRSFETLAALHPAHIMVDDDFRLLSYSGQGCACPLHLAAFNKLAGTDFDRPALAAALREKSELGRRYGLIFEQVQHESLVGAARAMRAGIDRVDPTLPGSFCMCGMDPAGEIGQILAGRGNPVLLRVNNGNYTPAGARNLSWSMYRAAMEMHLACNKADSYLAETDTCPQNRYSTGVQSLHAHFTGTILEGASGAKHWITRLGAFEPASGEAYRKKLAANRGFYEALTKIVPTLSPLGCRIPLSNEFHFDFTDDRKYQGSINGWMLCVLERLGLPMYFSDKIGGASFFDDNTPDAFSDEELRECLKGTVILSSGAAAKLNERGFGDLTGVEVSPYDGLPVSGEILEINGNQVSEQQRLKRLTVKDTHVRVNSMNFHLTDGVRRDPLCPGSTVFDNPLGGRTIVFCGTPTAGFNIGEAFSFLNESRKAQLVKMLAETGNLPVYYPGDAEVMLRAAKTPEGELFVGFFNIGLDPIEKITLVMSEPFKTFKTVEMLTREGERRPVAFTAAGENGEIELDCPALTLEPVILFLR